eukprot:scaffold51787_cov45-Phaeocystis_antarctica.AAC.1
MRSAVAARFGQNSASSSSLPCNFALFLQPPSIAQIPRVEEGWPAKKNAHLEKSGQTPEQEINVL